MSDQKFFPADDRVLRDLLLALARRPLLKADPRASWPPGGHSAPTQDGVPTETLHARRPDDTSSDPNVTIAITPVGDPHTRSFEEQLDVLLIEATLRLQVQVTAYPQLGRPSDSGFIATGDVPNRTAQAWTDRQGAPRVELPHVHGSPDNRVWPAPTPGRTSARPVVEAQALPANLAEESGQSTRLALWMSKRTRVGVAAVVLALLTLWGYQSGPRDFSQKGGSTSYPAAPHDRSLPTAGRSALEKSNPEALVGPPSVLRVEPPQEPPPTSVLAAAPPIVLSPDDGRAFAEERQDGGTPHGEALSPRPVQQDATGPIDGAIASQARGYAPTGASSGAGLDEVPDEVARSEALPVRRIDGTTVKAIETPKPLPVRKPPTPARGETTETQTTQVSPGARMAAVTPEQGPPPKSPASKNLPSDKKSAARFVPALMTLKDANSVLQVFIALQTRHAVLSDKIPEVRPVPGEGQATWYRLLVGPPVTQTAAENICRQLGPEGQTLGCAATVY